MSATTEARLACIDAAFDFFIILMHASMRAYIRGSKGFGVLISKTKIMNSNSFVNRKD